MRKLLRNLLLFPILFTSIFSRYGKIMMAVPLIANLFCCIKTCNAALLGELNLDIWMGGRGVYPEVRLTFVHAPDEDSPSYYEPISWDIGEEDVGNTFYISTTTHSSFADCSSVLTNGLDDQLYLTFHFLSTQGPDGGAGRGGVESGWWNKKYGPAEVDFQGCVIESMALTVNKCSLDIFYPDPYGPCTAFDFGGTIGVYGVPEPATLLLLGLGGLMLLKRTHMGVNGKWGQPRMAVR